MPGIRPGFLTMYSSQGQQQLQSPSDGTCHHQLRGISPNRVELESCIQYELLEDIMRRQSHSMAVALQLVT